MDAIKSNLDDIKTILAKRYDNGWDYWTTPDKRLNKGGSFSTFGSVLLLIESGMSASDPIISELAELIFSVQREDGRFRLSPTGGIYPCHTINALNVLCNLGYSSDKRLEVTLQHLLDNQYKDGGWRCKKFSYGKGPETEHSNPGPTLTVLDAFRLTDNLNNNKNLDLAVEFLLNHWIIRKPIGPCHYGIGTLFMQVEYPFRSYNLFYYVYILSYYNYVKKDKRFLEALNILESKMTDGSILIERNYPGIKNLSFPKKDEKSENATKRYWEIKKNLTI